MPRKFKLVQEMFVDTHLLKYQLTKFKKSLQKDRHDNSIVIQDCKFAKALQISFKSNQEPEEQAKKPRVAYVQMIEPLKNTSMM